MRDPLPPPVVRLLARRQILFACCLALFVLLPGNRALALDVPPFRGYVNDYGAMLSPAQELKLERALQSFDLTDSTQVAILTIDTLEGDALEDFSIRVVEQWKIGQKGKDNGVLFLAVNKDRRLRIEVGRGLEHVLTDLAAGRIGDTVVKPYFKDGRFDEGFEAGVAAIIQTTRGEYAAEPRSAGAGHRRVKTSPIFNYLFFGLALVAFLGSASWSGLIHRPSHPLAAGAGRGPGRPAAAAAACRNAASARRRLLHGRWRWFWRLGRLRRFWRRGLWRRWGLGRLVIDES